MTITKCDKCGAEKPVQRIGVMLLSYPSMDLEEVVGFEMTDYCIECLQRLREYWRGEG